VTPAELATLPMARISRKALALLTSG